MHPAKVKRDATEKLTDLPNVGPVIAGYLRMLHIHQPQDLVEKEPVTLYNALCNLTGKRVDPCVLDVFMSIIDFIHGNDAKAWWHYTAKRKETAEGKLK